MFSCFIQWLKISYQHYFYAHIALGLALGTPSHRSLQPFGMHHHLLNFFLILASKHSTFILYFIWPSPKLALFKKNSTKEWYLEAESGYQLCSLLFGCCLFPSPLSNRAKECVYVCVRAHMHVCIHEGIYTYLGSWNYIHVYCYVCLYILKTTSWCQLLILIQVHRSLLRFFPFHFGNYFFQRW